MSMGGTWSPSSSVSLALADTRHTVSDISKARTLGWEPIIPVEQNVAEYVAWLREREDTIEYFQRQTNECQSKAFSGGQRSVASSRLSATTNRRSGKGAIRFQPSAVSGQEEAESSKLEAQG